MFLEKMSSLKEAFDFHQTTAGELRGQALIPASLLFAHFISLSLHCVRAGKGLVALVAATNCPWLPGSVRLLLACLKDNQNVDRRITAACCLDVWDAPDSDCIITAKPDQSPFIPSFWAPLIHRIY